MLNKILLLFILVVSLVGCLTNNPGNSRRSSGGQTGVVNSPSSVSVGYGRYLKDSPVGISGDRSLSTSGVNYALYLTQESDFIISSQFLIGPCTINAGIITNCFEVREDEYAYDYLSPVNSKWAFTPSTVEFRQVQLYGNMRDIIDKFHEQLEWSYSFGLSYGALYDTSHPLDLFDSTKRPFWLSENILEGKSGKLIGLSECNQADNAYFSPASNEICLGYLSNDTDLKFVYDPTVTFHEMGHVFNQIMLNSRNLASGLSIERDTNLGELFYDEAGAIGEGLSDYFSYFMNQRTSFAEWSLGNRSPGPASRPLSESDDLHSSGISTTFQGRLSYPQYINYDPNDPQSQYEDIHYAGQIISHFLVALTEDLITECTLTQSQAINYTMHFIMESFAELGDQTSLGIDGAGESRVNLNFSSSYDWISKVNPINFRKFTQYLGKNLLSTLGNASLSVCTKSGITTSYTQDQFEVLADSYGLLLFKTYNNNANGITTGHSGSNTAVLSANRVKTVLIQKDLLEIDSRENATKAYIIDKMSDISDAVSTMQQTGQISEVSSLIDTNFGYNNGNARISPGEIVGISLNLYNDSNSTMAGIQVLANDWDHTKDSALCNNLGDGFPLSSEGAADLTSGEGNQGGCDYTTRYNGENTTTEPDEELAPICHVQIADDTSTVWYSQDELMRRISLDSSKCLGGSTSEKDCFFRAIKGADHAYFSQIPEKSTWAENFIGTNSAGQFNFNNVLFFEASPWIPPGTTFNCRFRARFTNCEDCWHDPNNGYDDYLDYEFSGATPFKILNFQFTVID